MNLDFNHPIHLKKLLKKEDFKPYFEIGYIPEYEEADNKIFIKGCKRFRDASGVMTFSKFIILDEEGNISNDSKYDFIELPEKGYLMNVEIDSPYNEHGLSLKYIVDINNIFLYPTYIQNKENVEISELTFKWLDLISDVIWANSNARIDFMKRKEFFENYIINAINK